MKGAGEYSGTLTAGSYRLGRALGGEGRVHEARHDRHGGRFALKLFGDVDALAFETGAHQAAKLRHPGIVQVVDYGTQPGRAFVVMEWIEGRSLAELRAKRGTLSVERVARLVDSIALGLQAAHRQGLAHGHLDPTRIFVLAGGGSGDETPGTERTKIVGFGLGDDLAPDLAITEETPYTAPEQLVGDAQPLADQFALGAIVYELLTGATPSSDGDERRPPRSLREYVPELNVIVDDVVQRALSPDPGARWADVYTFSKRLREAVDAGGELEEKTRLAPLPLTITRPASPAPVLASTPASPAPAVASASPAPALASFSSVVATPAPIDFPVIASVDVDLRTPAPQRLESPPSGGPSMHQPPNPFPGRYDHAQGQPGPNQFGTARAPAPMRPYSIQPTPTFSFNDEPVAGPMWKPRRRRAGGGFGLVVLVIAAGLGGYFAVQTHAWEQLGPLVARAKALASSLKTLAPSASREPPAAPTTAATATAPTATTPPTDDEAGANAAARAAAAPVAVHPEVVPIEPAPAAAKKSKPTKASTRPATAAAAATNLAPPAHRAGHAHASHARKPDFDEAAAEEALLGGP